MEKQKKTNLEENEDEGKDIFSQMMFGARYSAKSEPKTTASPVQEDQQADYMQIMNQLEDIYKSIQDLKPVLSEFSPIVDFIKSKFKK